MAVMFGRKSLGEGPEHLEHHFWKPKNLFGYCFRTFFFFFWPKNILWHLHHHLGRDRMRTELYPTAYRAYSWSVFRDHFKIGSGGYWGARNWTQVSCVLDKSPTLCTMQNFPYNALSFILEDTEHVLTSLKQCTLLTKITLNSVLMS